MEHLRYDHQEPADNEAESSPRATEDGGRQDSHGRNLATQWILGECDRLGAAAWMVTAFT